MPHLSPMTWYFVSEIMLLSVIIFMSILWWSFNSSLKVSVVFGGLNPSTLPWS